MRAPDDNKFYLEQAGVEVSVRRSARRKRSIAITIQKNGAVIIRAPLRVSMAELQRFAAIKADWMMEKLRKIQPKNPPDDTMVLFLGAAYPVRIETSALLRRHGFCEFLDGALYVHVPVLTGKKLKLAVKHAIEIWHKKQAAEIFAARADIYAAQLGVQYQSIKLADPKSRWGSCDQRGRLMLSWRAVMVRMALIDYLIVHELAHLIHFNHSKAYWQTVERILPDYKIRRAQLRDAERHVHG
jgi:predicted metal-dependent hydrolase